MGWLHFHLRYAWVKFQLSYFCSYESFTYFSSIGFETARRVGQEGGKVVVSSRREENVKNAVSQLRSEGLEVSGIPCHQGKKDDRKKLIQFVSTQFVRFSWSVGRKNFKFVTLTICTHCTQIVTVPVYQWKSKVITIFGKKILTIAKWVFYKTTQYFYYFVMSQSWHLSNVLGQFFNICILTVIFKLHYFKILKTIITFWRRSWKDVGNLKGTSQRIFHGNYKYAFRIIRL